MNFEFDNTRSAIPQGDVYLIPIKAIPRGATAIAPENGVHVVAHSETGHNHVIDARATTLLEHNALDQFRNFLTVEAPTELRHLRNYNTHAPQVVPPGNYLVQRQRTPALDGWARAAD